MSRCPRENHGELYTPSIRRAGRKDYSLPMGFCFDCFAENDRQPEYALYFPKTIKDFIEAKWVGGVPIKR